MLVTLGSNWQPHHVASILNKEKEEKNYITLRVFVRNVLWERKAQLSKSLIIQGKSSTPPNCNMFVGGFSVQTILPYHQTQYFNSLLVKLLTMGTYLYAIHTSFPDFPVEVQSCLSTVFLPSLLRHIKSSLSQAKFSIPHGICSTYGPLPTSSFSGHKLHHF